MTTARIIAELVSRGEEDLAEELLQVHADFSLTEMEDELKRSLSMLVSNMRKVLDRKASTLMEKEVAKFGKQLSSKLKYSAPSTL